LDGSHRYHRDTAAHTDTAERLDDAAVGEDRPIFDGEAQIKVMLGALIKRYNAVCTEIDATCRGWKSMVRSITSPVPSWEQKAHAGQRENMGARLLEGHDACSRNMEQAC
jgi:hypothetical protein